MNSPKSIAKLRIPELVIPFFRLGKITNLKASKFVPPNIFTVSTKLCKCSESKPFFTPLYMKGKATEKYAPMIIIGIPNIVILIPEYTFKSPTAKTTAGTIKGSRDKSSITFKTFGK